MLTFEADSSSLAFKDSPSVACFCKHSPHLLNRVNGNHHSSNSQSQVLAKILTQGQIFVDTLEIPEI